MQSTEQPRLAPRARAVEPFHVMRLLERAKTLEAEGRSIIHLEVGEPDFPTPEPILAAARAALEDGAVHYTPAAGLPQLRERLSRYYAERYGASVEADRILITPGASGAIQLVFQALLEPGDEVLICDPSYPCYRQVLRLLGVEPRAVAVDADDDFQLSAARAEAAWSPRVRALIVASPANPSGTLLGREQLAELHALCRARGAALIVDEIYQGLVYDAPDHSALELAEDVYVINSFSKYFGMTGWRLGWLAAPQAAVEVMERMAQNLFIAPNTPAQHAALAAFAPATLEILERRRACFRERRDALLDGLRRLGFGIDGEPKGAFYLYARLPDWVGVDSMQFATTMLEEVGVAATPGHDFGCHGAERHVRFAYTCDLPVIDEALGRIDRFLVQCRSR
ncbi:aminotransferase [Marichromatium purpuratum 984]|uniref:Aminotransferase n=1 Tax=Marichromatium purpuratum 984 TaxID=765910 RepID=W0E6Y3_MARPU|nr:aminotransferase class I/II-fold pyridoxal phosphate-dependent enzyme [Marichromatium purpuratum]AHF04969.1 aminotransferase [Marichromatium purpuratum 984]